MNPTAHQFLSAFGAPEGEKRQVAAAVLKRCGGMRSPM